MKSYVKYFIQYPGIFELFFLEKMYDIGAKLTTNEMIFTFPDRLCESDWNYCRENNLFNEEEIRLMKDELKYTVTSMLLFYLNRRIPDNYKVFNEMLEEKLNLILQRSNKNDR